MVIRNLEFAIGKQIGGGKVGIARECYTEKELIELYKALLVQSCLGTGYLPYHRRKDGKYILLETLAREVDDAFVEKIEREASLAQPN